MFVAEKVLLLLVISLTDEGVWDELALISNARSWKTLIGQKKKEKKLELVLINMFIPIFVAYTFTKFDDFNEKRAQECHNLYAH